jgi:glutamate formiminotransferase
MKVKVLNNFVDKVESAIQNKEVFRAVGEEFTVSKARFDEIKKAGEFVAEVKSKSEPKKVGV